MSSYRDIYKKVKKFDFSKWVVTKFYHYTSCARDVFAKYDTFNTKPMGDPYIKKVYEHFLKCSDAYVNYPELSYRSIGNQNKTTIEIFNIETGEKLYVTHYDLAWYIGKSVWSEFGSQTLFGKIEFNHDGKTE